MRSSKDMNSHFIAAFTVFCYLTAAGLIAARLFSRGASEQIPRLAGLVTVLIGLWGHAWLIYGGVHLASGGLNFGFSNAFSLVSWTILVLILFSSLSKPVESLAVLPLPLAAFAVVIDAAVPTTHLFPPDASWALRIHALFSLLGYSLLALASIQAVVLAIQDHFLRSHHPGGFIRTLPPLQTMETLLFEMIGLGFLLLTLALATGFLFLLHDMFAQRVAHKTVLSIAAWLVFGTLLWGRVRHGWRGQRALIWTLSGFVVLMLAYFGSKLVLELILTPVT
jgi:ABC-type uncharacterized transport system permease subunit